jgi:hypothetical protein
LIRGSGSTSKYYGSATLQKIFLLRCGSGIRIQLFNFMPYSLFTIV